VNLHRSDKCGSTMVESAIYFPMIILCVMFVIVMLINYYSIAAFDAHLHMSLREKAGEKSGTVSLKVTSGTAPDHYRAAAEARRISIKKKKSGLRTVMKAEPKEKYTGGPITGAVYAKRKFVGRSYVTDEQKLVRLADLAGL
jgi:hypothetical protein